MMSDDRINRSDAIEAVSISCRTCLARDIENCKKCSVPKLRELINAISSADRPRGEWIVNISDYKSVCSVCGANETDFIYGTEMWYGLGESKFCPSCGATMKGAINDYQYPTDNR